MQNNILAAMSDFIINIFEDILERYMIIILDALNIIAEGYITIIQYVLKFIYSFVQYRNDQIKQFECYLGQYFKLSVNFVSMLIDELLDYFNSVIDEFKNLEMKNKLIISFLISMLVFLIIISLYYKRCIDLLNNRNNELEINIDQKICCICRDQNSDFALRPCGHLCLCYECCQLLKENSRQGSREQFAVKNFLCPICRQKVVSEIRIY